MTENCSNSRTQEISTEGITPSSPRSKSCVVVHAGEYFPHRIACSDWDRFRQEARDGSGRWRFAYPYMVSSPFVLDVRDRFADVYPACDRGGFVASGLDGRSAPAVLIALTAFLGPRISQVFGRPV